MHDSALVGISWLSTPLGVGFLLLLGIVVWMLFDLFAVARWVREHNAAIGHG